VVAEGVGVEAEVDRHLVAETGAAEAEVGADRRREQNDKPFLFCSIMDSMKNSLQK
jgi:hypothetical protein